MERVGLSLRHAALLYEAGDVAAAVRELEADEKAHGPDDRYAVNLAITRASMLAEAGRHAEALTAVDAAYAAFRRSGSGERLPGSDREFAWVRACALHGLGRTGEARALMEGVFALPDPVDRQWLLKPNTSIGFRPYACMGDEDAAARLVAAQFGRAQVGAPTWLQPDQRSRAPQQPFLERLRRHPVVQAAAKGRVRPLPVAFVPALNRWESR